LSKYVSIPPYTPVAWTDILSGVNPAKHGIFGFKSVQKRNGTFIGVRTNTALNVMYPRIFEMFAINNLKSIVINVPLTYPPDAIIKHRHMIIVSDWSSPRQFIYPLKYEIKYKDWLVDPPFDWSSVDNKRDYADAITLYLSKRLEIYLDFLEERDFNLFVIIFSEPDWLMHAIPEIVLGHDINLVYKPFSLIDKFIKKATQICDLTVIVSDHGFEIARTALSINGILLEKGLTKIKYNINLNALFKSFLRVHTLGDTFSSLNLSNNSTFNLTPKLFNIIVRLYNKLKILPFIKLKKLLPISYELDYLNSKVIMPEVISWSIYTLKGYEKVTLNILRNSKLSKYIRNIIYTRKLFRGPYLNKGPNLIVIPEKSVEFTFFPHSEPLHVFMGHHEPYALMMLYGDQVLPTRRQEINEINIHDIVPTLLAYSGLPIPNDTDGKVIENIFTIGVYNRTKKRLNYSQSFRILRKLQRLKFR